MASFTISKVEVPFTASDTRQFLSVGTGAGKAVAVQPEVWLPGAAQPVDPAYSACPVVLRMDDDVAHTLLTIIVYGSYAFSNAWRANGNKCKMTGTGPGGVQIVTATPPAVPANGNDFVAGGFRFVTPAAATMPFKSAGDWTWSMTCVDQNGQPVAGVNPVPSSGPTRLEVYFTMGLADALFRDTHMYELLREAYVRYDEYGAGNTEAQNVQFLVSRLTQRIWDNTRGIFYDSRIAGGKPKYKFGSQLSLEKWIRAEANACNCQDVAAIVDVFCRSLATRPGANGQSRQAVNTKITTADWYGYITTGPLYGWNGDADKRRCNSPFWQGDPANGILNQRHFFGDNELMAADRRCFGMHVWTDLIMADGTPRVIDICHGVCWQEQHSFGTK